MGIFRTTILLLAVVLLATCQQVHQVGVLSDGTDSASFLTYNITGKINCLPVLKELSKRALTYKDYAVLALGTTLKSKCIDGDKIDIPQMRMYPNLTAFPHTPADFFVHIKTKKQDERFEIAYAFTHALPTETLFNAITITEVVGFSFQVGSNGLGRDLSGFEDGTENLKPEARRDAVLTPMQTSFMLTQKWVHNLKNWNRHPVDAQEKMIGRTKKDSVELNPLPPASHVERTEGNNMFRQSMPYGDSKENGLFFIAYVKDLHTFHHTLRMMGGAYNNVHDKIIGNLSVARTGAYWYVPNVQSIRQWAN